MRKKRYSGTLYTEREIEVWRLYKELGTQPEVAKKLKIYDSAVSQHINSVRRKGEACLTTLSTALEEEIIDYDEALEKIFPMHFRSLKKIAVSESGGSVYHLLLQLINEKLKNRLF